MTGQLRHTHTQGLAVKNKVTNHKQKMKRNSETHTLSGHGGCVVSPLAWPGVLKESYIVFTPEAPSFPSFHLLCVTLHLQGHSH